MAAGADSIDDLDVIRAGGMKKLFSAVYAPATRGIFLREFTHGHTRRLASVPRRHLSALAKRTDVLDGIADQAFVDIDSLLRPVYGRAKHHRKSSLSSWSDGFSCLIDFCCSGVVAASLGR
jgi:hypothetical protein